jgi:hypothetical protein
MIKLPDSLPAMPLSPALDPVLSVLEPLAMTP